jgi:hypothetical protein
MKITIESCEMTVAEVGLQFDFANDVLLYFGLSNTFLGHLFDDAQEAKLLLKGLENLSEGTLT